MELTFVLSLLVVSAVFSCFSLAVSIIAYRRSLEWSAASLQWEQLTEAYSVAAKEMQQSISRWDGDLDRLQDKVTSMEGAFKKFRARVNMRELREKDEAEEVTTTTTQARIAIPGDRPLTEQEKGILRRTLGLNQMNLSLGAAEVPRDIKED